MTLLASQQEQTGPGRRQLLPPRELLGSRGSSVTVRRTAGWWAQKGQALKIFNRDTPEQVPRSCVSTRPGPEAGEELAGGDTSSQGLCSPFARNSGSQLASPS